MGRNTDFSRGIPFTQFLSPNGKQMPQWIQRPAHTTDKARRIIGAGYSLHVEQLSDGNVSLTITDEHADHAIETCRNGVEIPDAVDRLILGFDENLLPSQEEEEAA